ncbi:MAG: patatin-like phospholipase family protein [Proteobacteria bacterium]|nr:patatin-like phospholipase family protein [Pseudomonadota bacterium]
MRARCICVMLCCAVLWLAGCSQAKFPPHTADQGRYTFFYDPNTRARYPEEYFKAEFEIISKRLKNTAALGTVSEQGRPEKLIGLGLSGGGIRSNAFQLGLLSGLEATRSGDFSNSTADNATAADKDTSLLDNVSYISAVSGGSWAMGTLAVNATLTSPREFFEQLNATVLNRETDDFCDDSERKSSLCKCKNKALCILNNTYVPALPETRKSTILTDPYGLFSGYYVRNAWRDMLLEHNLLRRDMFLSTLAKSDTKVPFVIFNSTHSAGGIGQAERHFPFQITPLGVSTIADCGNTDYCGSFGDHAGFSRTFDKEAFPSLTVSHAMAIAGAVLPESILDIPLNLMEWKLSLPDVAWNNSTQQCGRDAYFVEKAAMCESGYGNATLGRSAPVKADEAITADCPCIRHPEGKSVQRSWYILGDGGHSENLGALALLERGVDFLVISDAGYDPRLKFGDYGVLKGHAGRLLKQWVQLDPAQRHVTDGKCWLDHCNATGLKAEYQIEQDELEVHARHKFDTMREDDLNRNLTLGYYQGANGDVKLVVYARPAYKFDNSFMEYLRKEAAKEIEKNEDKGGYVNTYRYLMANPGKFPNDKTMAFSYDRELIFAYYLFGQYIAKKDLAPLMEGFLKLKKGK